MSERKLFVSSSPHVATLENTNVIMADVIIALLPALIGGVFFFGMRALVVVLTAVLSCGAAEWLWQILVGVYQERGRKKSWKEAYDYAKERTTVSDLSAVVTGVLLAFNLPVGIPLWCVVIASVFAIIIVKQLFGGIGHNFVNPALAARAFMLASWPALMTTWSLPVSSFTTYINPVDMVSGATPLGILKEGTGAALPSLYDVFIGRIGGCIGETSGALLLLGALYLFARRVIDWRIPLAYLGSFAVLMFLFGSQAMSLEFTLYNLFTGGIILGAFFMATDYVTTPCSGKGHIIFGIGCGVLTFVIRRFGGYPEGTSYAILLMNLVAPLIDRYAQPKKFGEVKGA